MRPSGAGRAPAGPPRPAPGELSFKDRASLRRALADVRSDEAALIATVRQDCKEATGTWKPNAANLTCRAGFHRRSVPDVAAAHDLVRRLGAAARPGRCRTALAGLGPALAELATAHRRAADWLDRAAANVAISPRRQHGKPVSARPFARSLRSGRTGGRALRRWWRGSCHQADERPPPGIEIS